MHHKRSLGGANSSAKGPPPGHFIIKIGNKESMTTYYDYFIN